VSDQKQDTVSLLNNQNVDICFNCHNSSVVILILPEIFLTGEKFEILHSLTNSEKHGSPLVLHWFIVKHSLQSKKRKITLQEVMFIHSTVT
jgi:hypothetical protein